MKTYLSAADGNYEAFLLRGAFDRSLLMNVLFGRGALIPDVFFFMSEQVESHLKRHQVGRTFLEHALRHGFVVPAFREPATGFESILHIIETERIAGLLEDGRAERVARRLDLPSTGSVTPVPWPKNMGAIFDNVVRTHLQAVAPPAISFGNVWHWNAAAHDAWESTRTFRTEMIERARETTANAGGIGLRRGDVLNALANVYGHTRVRTVSDLAKAAPATDKARVLLFCRWLSECYQFAQARAMTGKDSVPQHAPERYPAESLMAVSFSLAEHSVSYSERRRIDRTVLLPPPHLLTSPRNAESVIDVRASTGVVYLRVAERWIQRKASDQEFDEILKQYAGELCAAATGTSLRMPLLARLGTIAAEATLLGFDIADGVHLGTTTLITLLLAQSGFEMHAFARGATRSRYTIPELVL